MTRSTGTPTDAQEHIGEAKTALKAVLRSIDTLRETGLEPQGSAPGYDRRGLFGGERTPSRTGAPALGDARHPLEADGSFNVGGEVVHQGDTSGSTRGRWQRAMRHLADAVVRLHEGTDVERGAAGALLGAAVIADLGAPQRPGAPRRRAPHLLPTVDWVDARRMVCGLALMLGEAQSADLRPPEATAVIVACDEIAAAKRELPDWTRQHRRHAAVRRCDREGCRGRDGLPRKAAPQRRACWACLKRDQRAA